MATSVLHTRASWRSRACGQKQPMTASEQLARGRAAYRRDAWAEACTHLFAADQQAPLGAADLECLATAAFLSRRTDDCAEFWARAQQQHLERGDVQRAVRCMFWLVFALLHRGEPARARGWLTRARRLLEHAPHDCVEQGYLLLPAGMESIAQSDLPAARDSFSRAAAIADRFGDADLRALALHSRGRVLIRMGEADRGVGLLDEAMVEAEAGGVSAIVIGDVYCSAIEGCLEIFDVRRAQEWTAGLSRWCERRPDLVAYRGQCLIRRAEVMQLRGQWIAALGEAQLASERLSAPPGEPAAGAAFYRQAELHRLRGAFAEAEEAYRQAAVWGRSPQPGLALLRLAQGRTAAADTAIRCAAAEARDGPGRLAVLPACVEIMLAAGDVPAARIAANDIAQLAEVLDAVLARALAAQAHGAVLLAEGDAAAAVDALRAAEAAWAEIEAPYEGARVRALSATARTALGDHDTARMDLAAARAILQQLGAGPDLGRLEDLATRPGATASPTMSGRAAGRRLTPRELQVLRLVAAGRTNRNIAAELSISERTVERHVSNIFTRLSVTSRAAATAYAYEHKLV
jgi:DNA-binding NarL/FixJ family response regulator